MKEPKPPKKLFKYESFDTHSIRNLKNAQVFFNRPAEFNDPFDCAIVQESIETGPPDYVRLYNSYIGEKSPGTTPVTLLSQVPDIFATKLKEALESASSGRQKEILYNRGCCCFSEVHNDILMWSHYGNGHRGFCLEFDTTFKPFDGALKVYYDKQLPKWNPLAHIKVDEKKSVSDTLIPLRYKFENWKYEKEWRIFHTEPAKLFGYDISALTSVYFGYKIDTADLEIICLILLGQSPKVKFYRGVRDLKRYKVNFEPFNYTSHKDAI